MTVGERIKALRENKGLTQIELALAANTTKQNIYKYENNIVTNIPSDKIEAISSLLGVSAAHLMGWEAPTSPSQEDIDKALALYKKYSEAIPQVQGAVDALLKP